MKYHWRPRVQHGQWHHVTGLESKQSTSSTHPSINHNTAAEPRRPSHIQPHCTSYIASQSAIDSYIVSTNGWLIVRTQAAPRALPLGSSIPALKPQGSCLPLPRSHLAPSSLVLFHHLRHLSQMEGLLLPWVLALTPHTQVPHPHPVYANV